jgi:hypothetical protein
MCTYIDWYIDRLSKIKCIEWPYKLPTVALIKHLNNIPGVWLRVVRRRNAEDKIYK